MRQFILAKQFVENINVATAAVGDLGLVYVQESNDHHTPAQTHANFVLITKDGPIYFPIYPKNITGSLAKYEAGTKFAASFTVGEVNPYLDYVVTFVKKGKQFNERNKWSAVIHSKVSDTPETIAAAIAKYVNDNTTTLGLTAKVEGAGVTVEAKVVGEDYTLTFSDEMYGTELTVTAKGKVAFMGAEMIKDLFNKSAADRGYEYTFDDFDIYPGYEFNPLANADSEDTGFNVLTYRFTEPRVMGTREEEVYQIIQIAIPTGKDISILVSSVNEFSKKIVLNIAG